MMITPSDVPATSGRSGMCVAVRCGVVRVVKVGGDVLCACDRPRRHHHDTAGTCVATCCGRAARFLCRCVRSPRCHRATTSALREIAAILEPTRAMRLRRQATGISSAVAFPRALTPPTLVAARHTGHNDVYSTLADPRGSSHRDRTISTRLGSATRATLI